ncbi:amidohydrolase [Niallia circulans]|uniref:amidohydrolase family protein n=1 Tax=Niallia circulans TaxID=1397 RepID=UPI00201E605B|nr:amidohydrolase family protein [Niallia circulans]UQZ74759.1 amidohydrolase [Niallia circulans]
MTIIDVHAHPSLYSPISESEERLNFRMKEMGLGLMSPSDLTVIDKQNDFAKISKTILLPLDTTTTTGDTLISNDEIKKLVYLRPERFIGFASVDPNRADALEVLEHAFGTLGLSGLKLNPAKQQFSPDHPDYYPIYEKCLQYDKPIMFHAGFSWDKNSISEFAHPFRFERIAIKYPKLRMCLAHFGWPFVKETAILLVKYPNVYTDTSMLYMDSPELFFEQVFTRDMGKYWLDHNFPDKVMFGSNTPRFRPIRILRGLEKVYMSEKTRSKVLYKNAMRFLGEKGDIDENRATD